MEKMIIVDGKKARLIVRKGSKKQIEKRLKMIMGMLKRGTLVLVD